MPTRQERKEKQTRDIERITNRVRDSANRLFDGDVAKGFLFWAALDQIQNPPTEDDLLANITDGKDDLELDAYYVDDDAMTVYLFQSKYRSDPDTLKMRDLASFLDVPVKLSTPQILAGVCSCSSPSPPRRIRTPTCISDYPACHQAVASTGKYME